MAVISLATEFRHEQKPVKTCSSKQLIFVSRTNKPWSKLIAEPEVEVVDLELVKLGVLVKRRIDF